MLLLYEVPTLHYCASYSVEDSAPDNYLAPHCGGYHQCIPTPDTQSHALTSSDLSEDVVKVFQRLLQPRRNL